MTWQTNEKGDSVEDLSLQLRLDFNSPQHVGRRGGVLKVLCKCRLAFVYFCRHPAQEGLRTL